jgi:hypothetical protein
MDESSITQNRRSRRSNVLLAATIEAFGRVIPVTLRNLSREGVLIEGQNLPHDGSAVVFRRNELSVQSHVAWVNGDQGASRSRSQSRAKTCSATFPARAAVSLSSSRGRGWVLAS